MAVPKSRVPSHNLLLLLLRCIRSIKAMANDFKSRGWPLHVLLNNAGIQSPAGYRGQKTPGGFEVQHVLGPATAVMALRPTTPE